MPPKGRMISSPARKIKSQGATPDTVFLFRLTRDAFYEIFFADDPN
jgi:hypothetical protein